MTDYDLLVLGSGPGGQKAAIAAAKLGKRVCVVDRRDMVGGVCANTGTIPSKTLREAVLHLTGRSLVHPPRVRARRWKGSGAPLVPTGPSPCSLDRGGPL